MRGPHRMQGLLGAYRWYWKDLRGELPGALHWGYGREAAVRRAQINHSDAASDLRQGLCVRS